MKRSKREENGIIMYFIFYSILFIILIVFSFINVIPKLKQIQADKLTTTGLYNDIKIIEKSGLTFQEFKKYNNLGKQDRIITEILKNMTADFYNNNLVNGTDDSYKVFLSNKKTELNSEENKSIAIKQSNKIVKILPSYTDNSIMLDSNVLTDYGFINYVESIIESFNLTTNSSLGISKLILLDDFAVSNKSGGALDSNIFYIPLNITLKGTKSGIINFLYFIENVGNISTDENNIILNKDYKYLSTNGITKVLEGDRFSSNYNIFEHQIIDINSISINEYIDSSYVTRGSKDFKDFITDNQGNENFEIDVNLMFYVKGQPIYKIEEFITGILDKYKKITGLVNLAMKNTSIKGIERIEMSKMNDTIKQLNKEIITIKKSLVKKEALENLYKKVLVIDSIITPIYKSLEK